MVRDIRDRTRACLKLRNRIAINAHVGVVRVGEQPDDAGFFRNDAMAQFVFPIFRVNLPRPPHQIDSVRDLRHERFGEAETPVAVLVIRHHAHGVAARIGGIVPGAVVVDRPVDELKMRVGAYRIQVEEIRHAELAKANFQAAPRQFVEQRQKTALVLDLVFAQREHFVDHAASQVRRFAQQRIAHDVQIRIPGQAKALC